MKYLKFVFIFIITHYSVLAQNAFHNFGNVQIHNEGQIGFHINLINDGIFDNNNLGFAGFYSDNEVRTVSGDNRAVFYNLEIDTANDLELNTSMGVTNEMSFVTGKIYTPRNNVGVSLDYINHQFYVGEDDQRHVDGYSSVTGSDDFTFPIGDDDRLRPMILDTQNQSALFKGAYFFEDPNSPSTFSEDFLTDQKQVILDKVNVAEFWDLNGTEETIITLTWDNQSELSTLTSDINQLRVVGWSKTDNKWADLGNTNVTGDINSGQLSSNAFTPDDYEILTIGTSAGANGNVLGINYVFTPNEDGKNDTLVFEGLEQYNESFLEIFNRWGNLVYSATDYNNNWKGISNGRVTVLFKEKLPAGTYFYILKFGDQDLSQMQKGWIQIAR